MTHQSVLRLNNVKVSFLFHKLQEGQGKIMQFLSENSTHSGISNPCGSTTHSSLAAAVNDAAVLLRFHDWQHGPNHPSRGSEINSYHPIEGFVRDGICGFEGVYNSCNICQDINFFSVSTSLAF
jgi:hypothetical protein